MSLYAVDETLRHRIVGLGNRDMFSDYLQKADEDSLDDYVRKTSSPKDAYNNEDVQFRNVRIEY